jgi:hypothetical protein
MSKSDTPETDKRQTWTDFHHEDGYRRWGPVVHADFARGLERQRDELEAENNTLRGLLGNSAHPCTYCGLPAADQAKCARGFPGCARADDQMLSAHFAAGYAAEEAEKESAELRRERDELAEALWAAVEMLDWIGASPEGSEQACERVDEAKLSFRALLARIEEGKR